MNAPKSPSNASILVEHVSKWYGQISALNDVSLEIYPGILGLLGPNGAGKSTLLKILSGELTPSIGSVSIAGQDFAGNPSLYQHIGVCPENDALWDEANGFQFLVGNLRLQGWLTIDAEKRARELLDQMQLSQAARKRVTGYSKGMRQKLRLAQSIAHRPAFLFLDEPMTGLDATSRVLVTDLISELAADGTTVVFSSHILHEVEALTKEMVLIHQGQLRARGNVYEIRELLTDHPLQLEMTVSDPRAMATSLLQSDHVVRVEFNPRKEGSLTVFTQHQNRFFEELPDLLKSAQVDIQRLKAEDEDMESVFKYLVH
ncbi:MAG: ABC transporter ATP-binding protein [Acidobacteria bacterium]|nr:ABC transporter ATP-binding protein [Acidobacteriota bacterium]MCB9396904.1 ABC transporter ATP-binding protein [Acidobacteriota bacterium]